MIFSIRMYLLKEKTEKSDEVDIKDNNLDSDTRPSSLLISFDKNGIITKINKELEKISGYTKKEVLDRNILDFFIPTQYSNQWKNLIFKSKVNNVIEDYKLPLLTKNGTEILIHWSKFEVERSGGILDINLVGKIVEIMNETNENKQIYPDIKSKGFTIDAPIKNKKIIMHEDSDKIVRDIKNINEILDGKKIKQDFNTYDSKMLELKERENFLNKIESKLTEDKIKINEQVSKFKKWREKLETLENQLEYKREDIIKQDGPTIKITEDKKSTNNFGVIGEDKKKIDQFQLENISDCAVIIHRGILKQANDSFADLVGYKPDELKNKRLSDFIAPEGFSDVEKYYLNRLKGVESSGFETIFLTKDNNKIFVEVSTKPTSFNGLKAEIAVFKKIEK